MSLPSTPRWTAFLIGFMCGWLMVMMPAAFLPVVKTPGIIVYGMKPEVSPRATDIGIRYCFPSGEILWVPYERRLRP